MIRLGAITAGAIQKVRRLSDGRLAGFCGYAAEGAGYLRWLEGSESDKPALSDTSVVVISADGASIEVHEEGAWHTIDGSDFHAWGTGAAAALGALHFGEITGVHVDAEQAVEAAILVDPSSGGAVQSVSLGE